MATHELADEMCSSQPCKHPLQRPLPTWLRVGLVIAVLLGIFFRFYNLDTKVFWIDETYTALRMSGHTQSELVQEVVTGQVISADTLQSYQRLSPDKGWSDTLKALTGNAEHTPLYFLLARLWAECFGSSVAAIRSLSAVISLFLLPGVAWLAWESFQSRSAVAIAVGLVAVSPIHILYAQEARPYSLWSVVTAVSSAALLWALRSPSRRSWGVYAATVAIGLYSQLLFGTVMITQAVYMAIREVVWQEWQEWQEWRVTPALKAYLLATALGCSAFIPWLLVLLTHHAQVHEATATVRKLRHMGELIDEWGVTFSRVFLDCDLNSFNYVPIILTIVAIVLLCRSAPRQTWLFGVCLVVVPLLALILPDLILGGQRSSRLRYLFPTYIGVQIVFAYAFARWGVWARNWLQQLWRIVLITFLVGGIAASAISAPEAVWWTKSITRSGYYPMASQLINQADRPLVITDEPPIDLVAFSHCLRPDVKVQVTSQPQTLQVAAGFTTIYLLNPSAALRDRLISLNYQLTPLYSIRKNSREMEYNVWSAQTR